jgi:hypothetical protein
VRLASCIAAELAVGVTLLGGVSVAAVWGVSEVRSAEPAAVEGAGVAPAPARVVATAVETGEAIPRPKERERKSRGRFAGQPDEALLAPLRDGAIAEVKIGKCCTSLNMRIDFDNGARAAFKPRQRNSGSMPRKEIAAYRIDRLLGLGKVPPALGRRFKVDEIAASIVKSGAEERARFAAEMTVEAGEVDGELTWWIPELTKPKIDGFLIDSGEGVLLWQQYLTIGFEMPEGDRDLLAQISTAVVFDFLINNIDRWSGGNIQASADGSFLYYMDNTMSFRPQPRGHSKVSAYLRRSQKFSRSLVATLRDLRLEDLHDAVGTDLGPFPELLTAQELDAVLARRDAALRHVDRLITRHGEDAVLVFP